MRTNPSPIRVSADVPISESAITINQQGRGGASSGTRSSFSMLTEGIQRTSKNEAERSYRCPPLCQRTRLEFVHPHHSWNSPHFSNEARTHSRWAFSVSRRNEKSTSFHRSSQTLYVTGFCTLPTDGHCIFGALRSCDAIKPRGANSTSPSRLRAQCSTNSAKNTQNLLEYLRQCHLGQCQSGQCYFDHCHFRPSFPQDGPTKIRQNS